MSKRRVFLGTVAVVPRADLKRFLERSVTTGGSMDAALQAHLESVLALPAIPAPGAAASTDCALDVFVAKHQAGAFFNVDAGQLGFPLLWRPSVEITSRVYTLRSKKTIATVHVKKRLAWAEYINRMSSLRSLFGFRSPFTRNDLLQLLDEALVESLGRIMARI